MLRIITLWLISIFPLLGVHFSSSYVLAERTPQYPAKTEHTLFTLQQLAIARENVARDAEAKKVANAIISAADKWLTYSDDELRKLIPDASVPRDFDVSDAGCPKCGQKIFTKNGRYSWLLDPKKPLTVKCPICSGTFPDKDHPDDGWGWTSSDGKKYFFVAYANHWMMHANLAPAAAYLARAYVLTGEKKYAHKAAVLLKRFAEVYPEMDYEKQSSFAKRMVAMGAKYPGKIVNHIWETGLISTLAEAYDLVFDTMDQKDRSFVEANLLEDGIDAYYSGQIRGNFGMHQQALVYLGLVRQFGPRDKWFDGLLNDSSNEYGTMGLKFALYDMIYRDGLPTETSPGYNFLWVDKIAHFGELLKRTGRDVFEYPKMRRLFDAPLEMVQLGKFTPDLGDAGMFTGSPAIHSEVPFQIAYRAYHDEKYRMGSSKFTTFESLMNSGEGEDSGTEVPRTGKKLSAQSARLLDGFGMGILSNPKDTVSLSLYYGLKGGHGHFDRLGFELFANDMPLVPDLGYPDAMNDFVPGIYTWSKNTIAHTTVVVDGHRQLENYPGTVHLFANSPFARVMDVDGNGTYPQCTNYRRAMVMVDVDANRSYFVDFFDVAGGTQHDYSLHGPAGKVQVVSGDFSAPAKGTLAGEDVPLGKIYDAPELSDKTGYSNYTGSGFQHLFNVQRGRGDVLVEYQKGLRIHLLDQADQENILADAHVSPVNHPEIVKYLIARRSEAASRFVSVLEPYKEKAFVRSVKRLDKGAIEVTRDTGETDVIAYGPIRFGAGGRAIDSDAQAMVATFSKEGALSRLFFAGGTHVEINGRRFEAQEIAGKIVRVDGPHSVVHVKTRQKFQDLAGRIVHFSNAFHRSAHPVIASKQEGDDLMLTLGDDLLVGLFRVDTIGSDSVTTLTHMGFDRCYRGTTLATSDFKFVAQVRGAERGLITMAKPLGAECPVKMGEDVWLMDAGVGDDFSVPGVLWWSGE